MALSKAEYRNRELTAEAPSTIEDYCQRPRRRLSLNVLMGRTHSAQMNTQKWSKRYDACRAELSDRRQEIISQMDNLAGILNEIDEYSRQ